MIQTEDPFKDTSWAYELNFSKLPFLSSCAHPYPSSMTLTEFYFGLVQGGFHTLLLATISEKKKEYNIYIMYVYVSFASKDAYGLM